MNPFTDPDAPMCTSGKRPFRTEEAARYQLGRAKQRRAMTDGSKPGQVERRAYQCPGCEWWHLTAKRKR